MDGTGLSCYGLHCSALHLTGLDSTAIDLYGPGLCWIEMYLAGREGIGIGRERTGLDWTGADSTEWTGPHVRGVGRTGLSWTILQKTELDGTAPHWTGLS